MLKMLMMGAGDEADDRKNYINKLCRTPDQPPHGPRIVVVEVVVVVVAVVVVVVVGSTMIENLPEDLLEDLPEDNPNSRD